MSGDEKLRRWAIALSILGLVVSIYLIWVKFHPKDAFCAGVGDCEAVNTSIYSEFYGIPIAVFGAATYAVMLGLLLFEKRAAFLQEWGPVGVFCLALAGTLYSAYLTYLELWVIHKICPYCVISAITITTLLVLSIFRIRRFL
jgi:uncharacterized membrane protein